VTRLILCRHAEEGNVAEIQRLAAALAPAPLEAVYTSPLPRARVTADAVATEQELVAIDVRDLREIDFGEVEGLAFADYPAELRAALLDRPLSVRFPGGETYGELQKRVSQALGEIVSGQPGGTVAVVTHAGPIRAALAAWLGITDAAVFRIDQRTASVNVVDWLDGVPLIRLINGTGPCVRIQ
jgi:broad specificity phosphatase PhoE